MLLLAVPLVLVVIEFVCLLKVAKEVTHHLQVVVTVTGAEWLVISWSIVRVMILAVGLSLFPVETNVLFYNTVFQLLSVTMLTQFRNVVMFLAN